MPPFEARAESPAAGGPARGRPVVAWLVVLGITAGLVLGASGGDGEAATRGAHRVLRLGAESQFGTARLLEAGGDPARAREALVRGLRTLDLEPPAGPHSLRLRRAVVRAEAAGPEAALAVLDAAAAEAVEAGVAPTEDEAAAAAALRSLWRGEAPGPAERELLPRVLGWFGRLALAREPGPARDAVLDAARDRTTILVAAGAAALLALGAGLLLAGIALWALLTGRLRAGMEVPGALPHGLHAETFAAWMACYAGLSLLASRALDPLPAAGLAMACSAAVAAWPALRGAGLRAALADAGVLAPRSARSALVEVACGVATWLATLPLLVAGILATAALEALRLSRAGPGGPFDPPPGLSHPVEGVLAGGGGAALVLVLACVVAPLVEELYFRGFLHRHLRGATASLPRWASVGIAAATGSVLFAAVHPQGWTAIPVLASLAFGFALAREWRGSLLAGMAAHALNNGVVLGAALAVVPLSGN